MIDSIICGDCLEVLPTIEDKSVNMVLADLPYGTTKLKWDSLIPLDKLWCELSRITKDGSALVFTASQPFTTTLIQSNIEQFRYEWIWHRKSQASFLTANYRPIKSHENILVFSTYPATFTKQDKHIRYNPIKEPADAHYQKATKIRLADYGFKKMIPGGRVYTDTHPTSVINIRIQIISVITPPKNPSHSLNTLYEPTPTKATLSWTQPQVAEQPP